MSVVVRNVRRADPALIEKFAGVGVATLHAAQGRIGRLAPQMRPIYRPAHMLPGA